MADRWVCKHCDRVFASGPGLRSHEKAHEGISSRSKDQPPATPSKLFDPAIASQAKPAATSSDDDNEDGDSNATSGLSDAPTMSPLKRVQPKEIASVKQASDFALGHPFYKRGLEILLHMSPSTFRALPITQRLHFQSYYGVYSNEVEEHLQKQVAIAAENGIRDHDADLQLSTARNRRAEFAARASKVNGEYIAAVKGGMATTEEDLAVSKELMRQAEEAALMVTPELGDPVKREAIRKALEEAAKAGMSAEEEAVHVQEALEGAK